MGLAASLHKHVRYAQLEAQRRGQPVPPLDRLGRSWSRDSNDTWSLTWTIAKDVIFPCPPAKPMALFVYMYVIRLGMLDGCAGLRFVSSTPGTSPSWPPCGWISQ